MGPQRFGSIGLVLAVLVSMQPLAVMARADTEFTTGLLWRVEAANRARNYVFGTIHLTDPRLKELPEPVIAAILESRSLTLEFIYSVETQHEVASIRDLRDDRSLEEIIGHELFAKLADRTKNVGASKEYLRRLKPWAAAMILALPQKEVARQVAGAQPRDYALFASAHMRGLPIFALETTAERFGHIDTLAEADQISLLRLAIKEYPNLDTAFEQMIDLYLARDLAGLRNWWIKELSKLGARLAALIERRLLTDRNVTMTKRMEARLIDGGAFVAVDAMQLAGRDGILALLARRGFRVTKVY